MADPATTVPGVAPPLPVDGQQATLASRPLPSPAVDHVARSTVLPEPVRAGDDTVPRTDTMEGEPPARAEGAVLSTSPAATRDPNIAMADAATESTTAAAAAVAAAPADVPQTTEAPAAAGAETKVDGGEPAPAEEAPAAEASEATKVTEAAEATEAKEAAATKADATEAAATEATATEAAEAAAEPAAETKDDAPPAEAAATPAADASADAAEAKPTPAKLPKSASTASLARRKSTNQKLNRKGSKARITHSDAKPGEHYFVKLKGYPAWPVVVCDEDMLPQTLIKTRPVSAARADGTYREDYADGGKRAHDRVFPVMYLYTNEFGWVNNTDMHDLDPEKVLDSINDKMRKDLQAAHRLAAENNPLSHYKELLRQFQEELEQIEEAKRLAQATPKKAKKAAAKDGDVDMLDVPADDDSAPAPKKSASKKRKAEDDAKTPQRADSAKKPKIKITSSGTPKSGAANGTSSKTTAAPREAELSPEEKRRRKAKEVLFLRHKIQKGLLTRDQAPKEEEMKQVSDYLAKLEAFPDLEVGVIRETKINKVLKAILKIATIPREEEFRFKPRSQALLDDWNKILAAEPAAEPAAETAASANGTTTNGKAEEKEEKASNKATEPEKPKDEAAEEKAESKEDAAAEPAKEATEPNGESAPVEAAA